MGDESWCQFFGHDSLADYRGEVTAKVIPFRRPDSIKEWRRADGSTGQVAPIGRDVLDHAFAAVNACPPRASFRERVEAFRRALAENFAPLRTFLRRQG